MDTVKRSKKAAETNRAKYGKEYYSRIAKLSQQAWRENGRKPRGFAVNPELAREAGRKSRRGKGNKT